MTENQRVPPELQAQCDAINTELVREQIRVEPYWMEGDLLSDWRIRIIHPLLTLEYFKPKYLDWHTVLLIAHGLTNAHKAGIQAGKREVVRLIADKLAVLANV